MASTIWTWVRWPFYCSGSLVGLAGGALYWWQTYGSQSSPSHDMIADYNNRMDNPYIAAIHTLPGVRVWDYPFSKYPTWRDGEIVIEFGPKPAGLAGPSPAEGTVATS